MLREQNIIVQEISTSVSIREGSALPLIIVPGNSLNKECFQDLNDNPRLRSRQLIYYDFPGTGRSSRPADPEKGYGINALSDHLTALTGELGLTEFGLLGISLGGHVAMRAARLSGARELHVIGSSPIASISDMPSAYPVAPNTPNLFQEQINTEEAWKISIRLSDHKENQSIISRSILGTDPAFRLWMVENLSRTELADEIRLLRDLSIPWTLYFGENDDLINPEYIKTLSADILEHIVSLSGEKHLPDWPRFEIR